MFKSEKDMKLLFTKQQLIAKLNSLRDSLESNNPVSDEDLTTINNLAASINTHHSETSDDRICGICKKSFPPYIAHAELLVCWCTSPTHKLVVKGMHDQHHLAICQSCYAVLDLESHWAKLKPTSQELDSNE